MSRGNLSTHPATHDHEVRRGGFKVRPRAWWIGVVLVAACASGRDKDGATSITTLADNDEGGDEGHRDGGDDPDPAATDSSSGSDPSAAGSISDSSDPATTGDDGMGATTGQTSGPMTGATTDAPPPMPNENCLDACSFEEFCGISTFAECSQWCDPVDGGGPCDQALDQLYLCLTVLPDCESLWAYYEEPVPQYPCFMQDAAVGASCG